MVTTTKTVEEIVNDLDCPFPLSVIPNNMGINLSSVHSVTWTKQDDGQLVYLTINFKPNANHEVNNVETAGLVFDEPLVTN
jgi:hypothetical protein